MRSVENVECGKCGVCGNALTLTDLLILKVGWKMRSAESNARLGGQSAVSRRSVGGQSAVSRRSVRP